MNLKAVFACLWQGLRQVSGDDAYERYLRHWTEQHRDAGAALSRAAFFRQAQARKWDGIKRCC